MAINDLIVQVAKKYLGEHEKPSNSGFEDASFEKKMTACGWQKSQAWCAYFAELVWKESYLQHDTKYSVALDKLFQASATATYQKFDIDPNWNVSKTPVAGALAVWRHGVGWQGHIGIVSEVTSPVTFKCIEGNTNAAGGREGVEVAEKNRSVDFEVKPDKLNLIGFVIPRQ